MNSSKNAARRYALTLALLLTLTVLGTAARAQTESFANSATLICRPALATEAANAKMMVDTTSLVCRPLAVAMRMSDGSMKTIGSVTSKAMPGPDFSHALTAQQVNAAYNRWVEKALDIDPETRHAP
jgi:hypothetical protein